jgi:hypothetical protein
MRIFISYARKDAGDFAEQLYEYLNELGYEVFTDIHSLKVGEDWNSTLKDNISNCEIFVIIVTESAMRSKSVEEEVLQAKSEKKKIIPCFYKYIEKNNLKWGLNKIQGIEFDDSYCLIRNLHNKIKTISNDQKLKSNGLDETSKELLDNPIENRNFGSGITITSEWWHCQVCYERFPSYQEYYEHFENQHR